MQFTICELLESIGVDMCLRIIIFLLFVTNTCILAMETEKVTSTPENEIAWDGAKADAIYAIYIPAKADFDKAARRLTHKYDQAPTDEERKQLGLTFINKGLNFVRKTKDGNLQPVYTVEIMDRFKEIIHHSTKIDNTITIDLTDEYEENIKLLKQVTEQAEKLKQVIPLVDHHKKIGDLRTEINAKSKSKEAEIARTNFLYGAATIGGIWAVTKLFFWWQTKK
jgi:hypothetical protein